MRIATTKANRIYWHKRLEGFDETLAMTFDEKLTRRYGLRIGGGRTRIRTRVFGLEGQSDIQTTLYVLNRCSIGCPTHNVLKLTVTLTGLKAIYVSLEPFIQH